jgi:uncharacterized protein involved in exopolysaccharide biosynthesis
MNVTSSPSPSVGEPSPAEASPFDLVNMVLTHRRLIVWFPALLFIVVVLVTLVRPRHYTAKASFMPQTGSNALARYANLASQLGVTLPGQDPGQSPQFYADLIGSDELLRRVVDSTYEFRKGGAVVRTTLVELWGKRRDTLSVQREKVIRRLRRELSVSIKTQTGVVRVTMRSRYPELSAQVLERVLEVVNWFNLRKRQSQASQEALFIQGRLDDAKADLRIHEDVLQVFLQRNREYRSSAQLQFEHDRLEREVNLRQQTVTQLAQAYESSRIDEVRNTPVITTVEQPIVPPEPDRRYLLLKGALALLGGALFGMLLAVGQETIRRLASAEPHASEETRKLLREAFGRVGRAVRSSQ